MKAEDKRFSKVTKDPKFRQIPKAASKVKIDDRFQLMFTDEKFNPKYTMDKRGRPITQTKKEDLRRYYDLSSEDSDSEEQNDEEENETPIDDGKEESDQKVNDESRKKLKNLKGEKSETSKDDSKEKSELHLKNKSDNKVRDESRKKLKNLKVEESETPEDDNEEKSDLNLKNKSDKKVRNESRKKLKNLKAEKSETFENDCEKKSDINPKNKSNKKVKDKSGKKLKNLQNETSETPEDDSEEKSELNLENDPDEIAIDKSKKKLEDPEVEKSETRKDNSEEKSDLNLKNKSDKEVKDESRAKLKNLKIDYARGESALAESSSDDYESEDEESDDETIEHQWGELDADAETTQEATRRLAACNMDWDRIKAIDLMVLFNSFIPSGGIIKSVAIYPSEFGKRRMQEEEARGPIELVESKEIEEENEDGLDYNNEKLRAYQLNRLKYYYAVVEFDTAETANKVYTECDGMEYESSATKLDLRFIPDDMTFDDEPREICDKLPDLNKYQPRFFTTTALQQAKVDSTWDETDPDRVHFIERINSGQIDDINDDDLRAFIASSSGEESEVEIKEKDEDDTEADGNTDPIDKYRALLNEIQEKEKEKEGKDIQMEVVWDKHKEEEIEKLAKAKIEEKQEKTPFEQYLDKRKAKRKENRDRKKHSQDNSDSDSDIPDDIKKDPFFAEELNRPEYKKKSKKKLKEESENEEDIQRRAELELLVMDEDDSKKHFSLKKIQERERKKKNKKEKENGKSKTDDFTVDLIDDRFSTLYTSHTFNIEQTHPSFKETKNIEIIINEQLKRRAKRSENVESKKPRIEEKKSPVLNTYLKSVKQRTQLYSNKNE